MVIEATNGPDCLGGVVAIGACAGGVEALATLAAGLSADLSYAYVMVLQVPSGAPSILARIVDRSGPLPAVAAEDGMVLQPGRICISVPDHHLLVADGRVHEKARMARRLADKSGTGLLSRRYSAIAEETERALAVFSDRLSTGKSPRGGVDE